MDDFRKEVIQELEGVFGDGYQVLPYDKLKNNEVILHGICIHKENETVSPVIYLGEYILPYAAGKMTMKEIAAEMLERYCREDMPRNIADHVEDFSMMKDRVRIKVVNYGANARRLEQVPHRKFLDLAIVYYLDMETSVEAGKVTIEIRNELMERWDVSEGDLYRQGMDNMSAKDTFYADEMVGIVRKMAQMGLDEDSVRLLEEIEKEDGPDAELYVASNRKNLFGACCLLNRDFLWELAERTKSSLVICPINVNEVLIYPVEKGNNNHMGTKDLRKINKNAKLKEECLSNSIYLYDSAVQEVSICEEGAPL